MKYRILTLLLLSSQLAGAMGLEDFLTQVRERHKAIKSFEYLSEAAGERMRSAELELSPVLTLSGSYLDDKKTSASSPTYILNHYEQRSYSLGLAKKFLTGTQAQIVGTSQQVNTDYLSSGVAGAGQVGLGAMAVSISQSLWKDGFGSATRTRLERQRLVSSLEKEGYDLQLQQLLVDAESSYWDLVYGQNEVNLRASSLERARRIETWVRNRFSNGIGDRADVLNAQGLTASGELQLLVAQDELRAVERRVADIIGIKDLAELPKISGDIGQTRSPLSYLRTKMVANFSKEMPPVTILRLDSYLAILESRAKALVADEVEEAMKPDLSLQGSYQTNATDETAITAFSKTGRTDKPTGYVGLTLTWLLDGEVKSASRRAAKMDALAAVAKLEQKLIESQSSWLEIERRHLELTKKITLADKISQVQADKALAERDKLSKGRSITSQVISAEQDAAEAELVLSKLKTEQRKLESQGRLFVKVGNR